MSSDNVLRLAERIGIGIDIGESHFREFKSACTIGPNSTTMPRPVKEVCRDIGQALVAFANADGGEIFIGIEDDGTITGVPHKENLVNAMKAAYVNYVHHDTPLSPPALGDTTIDGNRVLYFSVGKSTDQIHLTSDGRCLRRFDRENRPVAFDNIRSARAEALSREYDREFVDGVTAADLDIDLLTYMAEHIAQGSLQKSYSNTWDWLNTERSGCDTGRLLCCYLRWIFLVGIPAAKFELCGWQVRNSVPERITMLVSMNQSNARYLNWWIPLGILSVHIWRGPDSFRPACLEKVSSTLNKPAEKLW